MDKLLIYSGYDTAGPHIFPVELGQRNGHIKLATEMHPVIAKYIADAKSIPGKSQLLIDAMGSGEFWGSNRNGDYFPEEQLNHNGDDYGYRTFMRYAYPFRHHVNKDPKKAYGDKVILSVYLPSMHRVQLIVAVHDDRCEDILGRVDNGDYPDVSMGCRVPYDQCSICGNRAKNRGQYCDHLKYQMNRMLPDGRRVMAVNWHPKFFDISFVNVGAEKASHVLMKVAQESGRGVSSAELGEAYYRPKSRSYFKRASVKKQGDISKRVPLVATNVEKVVDSAPAVKRLERPISEGTLNTLAKFPVSDVFSTLAFMGIDPRPEEFQKIILIRSGQSDVAEDLSRRNIVFDENACGPSPDAPKVLDISVGNVNEKVAHIMRPYLKDRSCFSGYLVPRLEKFAEDENQWYESTNHSLMSSVPLALGLAGAYAYLKHKAPIEAETGFAKAIARHPWLLGLLFAGASGASGATMSLLQPQPLGYDGDLDSSMPPGYDPLNKTAGSLGKKLIVPLAMVPLAYMYSGIQRNRARHGERLNSFDRFVAKRPDLAAIGALIAGPPAVSKGQGIARSLGKLVKTGGLYSDWAAWALLSGPKLAPAALIGSMVDASVVKSIASIASKRGKKNGHIG